MHDNDGTICQKIVDSLLSKITLVLTESKIKSIYPNGFYSMWLSNHWLLMWFYQNFGHKYDYFWSMEYDVRISGDSSKIWLYDNDDDFLYVTGNILCPNNIYKNHYIGGKLTNEQKYYGFLQISRYSKKFLGYLDRCFNDGENGQDELIIFSLARRGHFKISGHFLNKLVKGVWSWEDKYVSKNITEYHKMERSNRDGKYLAIFHPIK